MRRTEQEQLIDRYLAREMDTAERRAFEQRLAGDKEFSATFRAEVLVRNAMGKDRAAIPTDHSRTRASVIGMLGAIPAGAVAPIAGGGAGLGALFTTKLVSTVAATLGILGGSLLMTLPGEPQNPFIAPGPASAQPMPPAPPDAAAPASVPDAAQDPGQPTMPGREALPSVHARPAAGSGEQQEDASATERRSADGEGATVISSDSVRMKLKLDLKKIHKNDGD